MTNNPTLLGTVQDVQGASVRVVLDISTAPGLTFIDGQGYRIGQVGSFVRIPIGFVELFGIVSQVGAGAVPESLIEKEPYGNRWMKVELVGEGDRTALFQRGISQYPTIGDEVHIVSENDLKKIYGPGNPDDFIPIGNLASAEAIPSLVNINGLVNRHSAIVGTTGSGKSTTVAGLVTTLADTRKYPSARILIFDIHGEYAKSLSDISTVFSVGTNKDSKPLYIPYWALSYEELMKIGFGSIDSSKMSKISDIIYSLKNNTLKKQPLDGISVETMTVDSPIPFSIHNFWFEQYKNEYNTFIPKPGGSAGELEPAYVLGDDSTPIQLGDPMKVIPPLYRNVKTTGKPEERVQHGQNGIGIRQQLTILSSKLRDPRFDFLFRPGDWLPDIDGKIEKDIDELLEGWIGGDKPITIFDLSGIPSTILNDLIGALLRIIYDSLFWARRLPEGGRERPLLIVLEEAHNYLGKDKQSEASLSIRRIAKEGRKYGVGIMLVSQRPSEIDSTILSQCGTIFAMRLANDIDRGHVTNAAPDNLKGLFDMLPILRTGEAIIIGEAVSLPIRTLITSPRKDRRPDSRDPCVVVRGSVDTDGFDGPGGWNQIRDIQDYSAVVRMWRKQNPQYEHKKKNEME